MYAVSAVIYVGAFGFSFDGFGSPAPSASLAATTSRAPEVDQEVAAASRSWSTLVEPAKVPRSVAARSGVPSTARPGVAASATLDPQAGAEPTAPLSGVPAAEGVGLPIGAEELVRDAGVSVAAGLEAAVPVGAGNGPVVGGRIQPRLVVPPRSAEGTYQVISGRAEPSVAEGGQVIRYVVEVERGLPFDGQEFAAEVHRILNDPRGWRRNARLGFERVDHGPVRLRVSLSSPAMTDAKCAPLRTFGRVSCWNRSRAVINALRWGTGAATYGNDILSYREYLISHEVGHGLGNRHISCPARGRLAPIMVQQTKSLEGCVPNPWPHP